MNGQKHPEEHPMEPTSWTDSPYVGICIRPRATIRAIVDRDPKDSVIALVLIAAVVGSITNAIHGYSYNPTAFTIGGKPIPLMDPHTSRLMKLWVLSAAPLLAIPFLYIKGSLFRWTGSLLGGMAKTVEVRAAIAWPAVVSIVIALVLFVIGFWVPPPSQPTAPATLSVMREYWRSLLPSMIVSSPLLLWSFVVSLKCLGEVHRFSAWRALGAWLIGILLLGGAMLVALLLVGIISAIR